MLSKAQIKLIQSLQRKKERDAEGVFVCEGIKTVRDVARHFKVRFAACTEEYEEEMRGVFAKTEVCTKEEIAKASLMQSPQGVIVVAEKRKEDYRREDMMGKLVVALDTVQDPGNVGTIVRLCDWFGVKDVICSHETADIYNPKTVQATMGAIARVRVHYVDLRDELVALSAVMPVYGTFLDGDNIYKSELKETGVIVMGNEGNGISREVGECVNRRLRIPNYPEGVETSESLNVSMATGIVLSEFRRRG